MTETQQPEQPEQSQATADDAAGRKLSRAGVLNRLVNLYPDTRYLEVGVSQGVTFNQVEAPHMVAVDPVFRFDHEQAQAERPGTTYHQVTSDVFFSEIVGEREMFDVIYLDGLHTFEQTLRDLMNALEHLQPQGVILIDDTHPPTHLASLRNQNEYFKVRRWLGSTDRRWMGDVYRLVWFIDTFCPGLSFGTLNNNHGQTVIWRKRRGPVVERMVTEVGALSFEEMVLQEDTMRVERFGEIRRRLRADLGL